MVDSQAQLISFNHIRNGFQVQCSAATDNSYLNSSTASTPSPSTPSIPSPPRPCNLYRDFLIYNDAQLNDANERSLLVTAIHAHHSPDQGGRKFLYVHPPEYHQRGITDSSSSLDNNNFCLLQQSIASGDHRCSRVLLWLCKTTIERFSSYRSSNFGSLHINVPKSVQEFIRLLNEKFLVTPSSTQQLKVRCELDESGCPLWKTEEVFHDGNYIEDDIDEISVQGNSFTSSSFYANEPNVGEKQHETKTNSKITEREHQTVSTATSPVVIGLHSNSQAKTDILETPSEKNSEQDDDESFISAIKKKKAKTKRDCKMSVSLLEHQSRPIEENNNKKSEAVNPSKSSDAILGQQYQQISLFGYPTKTGEIIEDLHYPPCLSLNSDIFEYLRPVCVPRHTKADILIQLHHVCPFRQTYSLILSLVYLRIYHTEKSSNRFLSQITKPLSEFNFLGNDQSVQTVSQFPTPSSCVFASSLPSSCLSQQNYPGSLSIVDVPKHHPTEDRQVLDQISHLSSTLISTNQPTFPVSYPTSSTPFPNKHSVSSILHPSLCHSDKQYDSQNALSTSFPSANLHDNLSHLSNVSFPSPYQQLRHNHLSDNNDDDKNSKRFLSLIPLRRNSQPGSERKNHNISSVVHESPTVYLKRYSSDYSLSASHQQCLSKGQRSSSTFSSVVSRETYSSDHSIVGPDTMDPSAIMIRRDESQHDIKNWRKDRQPHSDTEYDLGIRIESIEKMNNRLEQNRLERDSDNSLLYYNHYSNQPEILELSRRNSTPYYDESHNQYQINYKQRVYGRNSSKTPSLSSTAFRSFSSEPRSRATSASQDPYHHGNPHLQQNLDEVLYDDLPHMHPKNVKHRSKILKRRSITGLTESLQRQRSQPVAVIEGSLERPRTTDDTVTLEEHHFITTNSTTSEPSDDPQYSIGDLVELIHCGGRKDLHQGQRGEILSIAVSESQDSLVSIHLCRADGKRQRLEKANAIKKNIPASHIRLLESVEQRLEQQKQEQASSIGRSLPNGRIKSDVHLSAGEFFAVASGDFAGVPTTAFKHQLVGTPFSLSPPHTSNGVLCFFWDLEATGLDVRQDDITQIACVCHRFYFKCDEELNEIKNIQIKDGMTQRGFSPLEFIPTKTTPSIPLNPGYWEMVNVSPEPEFNRYVHTNRIVPKPVVELTGITNEFLNEHGISFGEALNDWKNWILTICDAYKNCPVWFIAHNGNRYDLPLLFQQEASKLGQTPGTFLKSVHTVGIVDTVILSRRLHWNVPRRSHKLQTLYYDIFHCQMPNEHDALGDVTGLAALMAEDPFLSAFQTEMVGWRIEEYSTDGYFLSSPSSFNICQLSSFYPEGTSKEEEQQMSCNETQPLTFSTVFTQSSSNCNLYYKELETTTTSMDVKPSTIQQEINNVDEDFSNPYQLKSISDLIESTIENTIKYSNRRSQQSFNPNSTSNHYNDSQQSNCLVNFNESSFSKPLHPSTEHGNLLQQFGLPLQHQSLPYRPPPFPIPESTYKRTMSNIHEFNSSEPSGNKSEEIFPLCLSEHMITTESFNRSRSDGTSISPKRRTSPSWDEGQRYSYYHSLQGETDIDLGYGPSTHFTECPQGSRRYNTESIASRGDVDVDLRQQYRRISEDNTQSMQQEIDCQFSNKEIALLYQQSQPRSSITPIHNVISNTSPELYPRFTPSLPPVYASIYSKNGITPYDTIPGRLSRRVSADESHNIASPFTPIDYRRVPPGDVPPSLPCPGVPIINIQSQREGFSSSAFRFPSVVDGEYSSNDKSIRDAGKRKQAVTFIPPYPPPSATPEAATITATSSAPSVREGLPQGSQGSLLWKPTSKSTNLQGFPDHQSKTSTTAQQPHSGNKNWGVKSLVSLNTRMSTEYRKGDAEENFIEDSRKPQAKLIMKRSSNPLVIDSAQRDQSISVNQSQIEKSTLIHQLHKPLGSINNNTIKKSIAKSPEWRTAEERSEIASDEIPSLFQRAPFNRQQNVWNAQPRSVNDKRGGTLFDFRSINPPKGFSLYSTEKETREIQQPLRLSPQQPTIKTKEQPEEVSIAVTEETKTESSQRPVGFGTTIKHVKILKRSDAEKSEGKMHLAAAIAGLSYDVASETFHQSGTNKSGGTSTKSGSNGNQLDGTATRLFQRRNI